MTTSGVRSRLSRLVDLLVNSSGSVVRMESPASSPSFRDRGDLSDAVENAIAAGAVFSAVNLSEVVTKMVGTGADPELVLGPSVEVRSRR